MSDRPKILILDDEERITEALVMLFEDDFDVFESNDPLHALATIKQNKDIQLVISDYKMPELDGQEFLKRVQAENPDIYRMILSGYADAKSLLTGVGNGVIQKFLTKPWEPEILLTIVKQRVDSNYEH